MTFLLCDPGWCIHKSDLQNKWDDSTLTQSTQSIGFNSTVALELQLQLRLYTVVLIVCITTSKTLLLQQQQYTVQNRTQNREHLGQDKEDLGLEKCVAKLLLYLLIVYCIVVVVVYCIVVVVVSINSVLYTV